MPKSSAPDTACLDEVVVSDGVGPSRLSRPSFWERLLVNHLRNRPTSERVGGDVSDSANAKGPFLGVARSERSEFKDAAAVCGWARSGFDSRGSVSDLPAMLASTSRMALSRDKRSFAIADSESGG